MMKQPVVHWHHERELAADHVVGVDEVGYGAWAGPIGVAAAYIDSSQCSSQWLSALRDSKTLSAKQRHTIIQIFTSNPQWGEVRMAWVDAEHIKPGLALRLTLDAMAKAVQAMSFPVQGVVVDGRHDVPLDIPQKTVCGADSQSASVALASIVAKVARDTLMTELHEQYPMFGWATNMGYGTAMHRLAVAMHGVSPHHRVHYCASALKERV
jgi:ribonuclease HII